MQTKRITRLLKAGALVALMIGLPVWQTPEPAAATGGNSVTSPDTDGFVGRSTSLVLDVTGYPVISYEGGGNLKVLHCNDPDCKNGGESVAVADTADSVGQHTSLALDASGNPVVSYYDQANHDLKLLHCNDPDCLGDDESIETPATTDYVGWENSLALDESGYPVVSYYDFTHGDLKVLRCDDPNCAGDESANTTSPDTDGDVGRFTSLELDASGNPVVSYMDWDNGDLKVLHCNDPNCSGGNESITSPDAIGQAGIWSSLALDSSGNPVVSYVQGGEWTLRVLHCNDPNCSGSDESISQPDPDWGVGEYASLALDAAGNPVVSYYDAFEDYDLKVLHCNDPDCSGGDESVIAPDTADDVGRYTSLTLDASGNPVVGYQDVTNHDLKVLHCGDPNCTGDHKVGGIAELPGVDAAATDAAGPSWPDTAVLGGIAAAAAIALGGAAWYVRRRRR